MGLTTMTTFLSLLGCALLTAMSPQAQEHCHFKNKDLYNYMPFNN